MRARAGGFAVAALIVDEAGDVICRQRRGGVPVAGAMFSDAVHDDKTRSRSARQRFIAGKSRADHGLMSATAFDCTFVSSQIPANTSTVPAATQAVNGSPRRMTAIKIVDSGPMVPACAVSE